MRGINLTTAAQKYDSSPITDIDGLAEFLDTTRSNLRNGQLWRQFPHVFVGQGRDLRAARFNIHDVWAYLTQARGENYGGVEKR